MAERRAPADPEQVELVARGHVEQAKIERHLRSRIAIGSMPGTSRCSPTGVGSDRIADAFGRQARSRRHRHALDLGLDNFRDHKRGPIVLRRIGLESEQIIGGAAGVTRGAKDRARIGAQHFKP